MSKKRDIIIVGAGLAGSLMAIMLAKKGHKVTVLEKRPDMRAQSISAGRSINLALSDRGLQALRKVGLEDKVLNDVMPMKARLIHSVSGEKDFQPYSGREGKHINSVSRGGLNITLMDAAEALGNVTFYFEHECQNIDFDKVEVTVNDAYGNQKVLKADHIIGGDGAGSVVRTAFQMGGISRFNYSQHFLEHGYKELEIPPSEDGGFRIENNVLHIWPRGTFMMIALPNLDGSFTCTLFMPFEGEHGFDNLDTKEKVMDFFEKFFPDAIQHMPTLLDDFFTNPHDKLGTIKCYPWAKDDKAVLIGDAAHAVVPFYGQGMNASFEDCYVLDELLDNHEDEDWGELFDTFQKRRKDNADAIADLAIQNYYEMRDHVANPDFVVKRHIEMDLEKHHDDFNSKYSLVTFCPEVPYAIAKKRGEEQDNLLMEIVGQLEDKNNYNTEEIFKKIKKEIKV